MSRPSVTATSFTRLVGCDAPIQLAPMPGISTPELVAAVSEAGGLGMLPTPLLTPAVLEAAIDSIEARTRRPFGVSFLMPFLDPACVEVAARRTRVVDFFYGDPDPGLVETARARGARVSWQVGSLDEALRAERAGCDFVIAQGTEAGGHVRGRTALLPLLSQLLDGVRIPVLGAGGIATARDLAAVLACGAAGVRMGTRFVASTESGAHPDYVKALLTATAADTCLTGAFSVMWPQAPHRVLRACIEAAERTTADPLGEVRLGGVAVPVARFSVICPTRDTSGPIEAMALYAGESVSNVSSVLPAARIVSELVSGAIARLTEAGSLA